MMDHFSKFAFTVPLKDKSANSVADGFMKELVLKFGTPVKIYSDRGMEFVNETL
jgi:hypothetical protein